MEGEIHILKEDVKLSLFADEMILYLKNSQQKTFRSDKTFSNVVGYKIYT
jgi:hypothetical protein